MTLTPSFMLEQYAAGPRTAKSPDAISATVGRSSTSQRRRRTIAAYSHNCTASTSSAAGMLTDWRRSRPLRIGDSLHKARKLSPKNAGVKLSSLFRDALGVERERF